MYMFEILCNNHVQYFANGPDYMNSVCINKYVNKNFNIPIE